MARTTPYVPRPETVEAFTEGDCWWLAYTISRLSGLPMVFANPCPEDPLYWEHVGVLLPDGRVLDVNGPSDAESWTKKWARKGIMMIHTDPDRIFELLADQDPFFDTKPHRPARRLLETYYWRV